MIATQSSDDMHSGSVDSKFSSDMREHLYDRKNDSKGEILWTYPVLNFAGCLLELSECKA